MTTVAYDGRTLAADSMLSTPGWKSPVSFQKVFANVGEFQAIGFCGCASAIEAFLMWIENPEEPGLREALLESELLALAVHHDGNAYLFEGPTRHPLPIDHFHAIGSGSEFAISAMLCGKSAAEAIEVSKKLDFYTGGKVQFIELKNPKSFDHERFEL